MTTATQKSAGLSRRTYCRTSATRLRDWWTTRDGTLVAQQRHFDPVSGILTVESRWRRGASRRGVRRDHRIRLYTATRLAELCADAGLVVEQAFDNWTPRPLRRASGEMLLVARRER